MNRECVIHGLRRDLSRALAVPARSATNVDVAEPLLGSSRHCGSTLGGAATTMRRTFWRISSSRTNQAGLDRLAEAPTSSAISRFTRGSRSAFRSGSSWYVNTWIPARYGDWKPRVGRGHERSRPQGQTELAPRASLAAQYRGQLISPDG